MSAENGIPNNGFIAAIDLGSNSFHMIVGRLVGGQLNIVDRLREPVRLGAGLQADDCLDDVAKARALACLAKFGQRLSGFAQGEVRAVGTNTLRKAKNADGFIEEAEALLGYPIEIISGMEEARLIHLGVINGIDLENDRHLVIDIGGGSTELIVGEQRQPIYLESLYMGCVSHTQAFFNKAIDERQWLSANIAAKLELMPVAGRFSKLGWKHVIGTSGSIRAIEKVAVANDWSKTGVTLEALKKIREALCKTGDSKQINLPGLSKEREEVFAGGVVVLEAIFETLNIKRLEVSDYSLREGVLYDMFGRINQVDIRDMTVKMLMERYQCDAAQAQRVANTQKILFDMVKQNAPVKEGKDDVLLGWAAQLHEMGLTIAHSQYHKHGAYIAEYADMAGFTRTEQRFLAMLIRNHRRKIQLADIEKLAKRGVDRALAMVIILRLAVLLNRSRVDSTFPPLHITVKKNQLALVCEKEWLNNAPLTKADLEQEIKHLKAAKLSVTVFDRNGAALL